MAPGGVLLAKGAGAFEASGQTKEEFGSLLRHKCAWGGQFQRPSPSPVLKSFPFPWAIDGIITIKRVTKKAPQKMPYHGYF